MQAAFTDFKLTGRWREWTLSATEHLPPAPSSGRPLRVAVVGGGDIGVRNANSVKAASNATIAAVCDINPQVLRTLSRSFSAPGVAEYDALLKRDDVDAVLLSLPHFLHEPFTLQAARAGKHILLEKPLGVDLASATSIVQGCADAGVRLTVNFSFRYIPTVQFVKHLLAEGILGEFAGVQISLFQYKGARYWAGGYTQRASDDWRTTWEKAGGGILINTVCHSIDYVRFAVEREISHVHAEYGTFASPIEVEDSLVATFRYDNSAIGSVNATSIWRAAKHDEVRLWGTHGSLIIHNNSLMTLFPSKRYQNVEPGREHKISKVPSNDYTSRWIDRFAYAVLNDEPHEIDGLDGWVNNATIEAAYRSRELGGATEVATWPATEEARA